LVEGRKTGAEESNKDPIWENRNHPGLRDFHANSVTLTHFEELKTAFFEPFGLFFELKNAGPPNAL
jgi:hypothetical protein